MTKIVQKAWGGIWVFVPARYWFLLVPTSPHGAGSYLVSAPSQPYIHIVDLGEGNNICEMKCTSSIQYYYSK